MSAPPRLQPHGAESEQKHCSERAGEKGQGAIEAKHCHKASPKNLAAISEGGDNCSQSNQDPNTQQEGLSEPNIWTKHTFISFRAQATSTVEFQKKLFFWVGYLQMIQAAFLATSSVLFVLARFRSNTLNCSNPLW